MHAVRSSVLPAGLGAATEFRVRKPDFGAEFGLGTPDPRAFQPGHLHRDGAHDPLQLHAAASVRKGPWRGRERAFAARIGDRHVDRLAATPLRRTAHCREGGLGHGRSPDLLRFYCFYGFYDWECGKSGGIEQFGDKSGASQCIVDFHGFHGFHGFARGWIGVWGRRSGGGCAVRVLFAAFPGGNPSGTAGRTDLFSPAHRVDVEKNRDCA